MIIEPRIRNNICLTAHPEGCAEEVRRQIEYVKSRKHGKGPVSVLVIGSSSGYGLSCRITAAFGYGASTVGVFFEKPGTEKKPGTPGYYNMKAFDKEAGAAGLYSKSINGDAFSHEIKQEAVDAIKAGPGKVDLVVYSLASGVRKDPDTGVLYTSSLKTVGSPYSSRALDAMNGILSEGEIQPANEDEIASTVKVMGGEDWKLWINTLLDAGVLADGARTVAFSYIGPEVTHPIYRNGTIGKAKENLEATAFELDSLLSDKIGGGAWTSVNKALVTKAAAVIPAVSLYITLLFRVMKDMGLHEGCIEQMDRLFSERLFLKDVPVDEKGRIRMDDLEMRDDVQKEVQSRWNSVTEDNINELGDLDGYRLDFLRMHGFNVPGIDYSADVATD